MDGRLGLSKETLEKTPAEVIALLEKMDAEIRELRSRLGMNSSNSSCPPSSDGPARRGKRKPPTKPSGRKRGGQKGRPKYSRPLAPPEKVAETVVCKPAQCQHCDSHLDDDPNPIRHQVAEIPPIEPHITEYQIHRCSCAKCGDVTRGKLPPGVPRGNFGPRLMSIFALWAGGCRLGKRTIQELARATVWLIDFT